MGRKITTGEPRDYPDHWEMVKIWIPIDKIERSGTHDMLAIIDSAAGLPYSPEMEDELDTRDNQ